MRSAEARERRDESRNRLRATLTETKARLKPAALAKDGVDTAARTIKTRPLATIGTVAAAALYLFRKPVFSALLRLTKEKRHD